MSQYHKKCCPEIPPNKTPERIITSKAFCDCQICTCRDCPDILEMLSITVSDTTCHFDSKVVPTKDENSMEKDMGPMAETLKILDIVTERDCNCGVIARGLQDNVHANLGLQTRREGIKCCEENCKITQHKHPAKEQDGEENGESSSNSEHHKD